jgi:subtilase family protein/thrombospondin type 3 repeat protein
MKSRQVHLYLVLLTILFPIYALALPEKTHEDPNAMQGDVELIVLLAAGPTVPTPEALTADVNHGRSPFHLPVQPLKARTALPFRASGETLAWLRAHPDSPRARLERYVVLSFPPRLDLAPTVAALAAHPYVLHVEENVSFTLSVDPTNDPYMHYTGDPTTYQWGSYTLNLPAAWNRIHGHAYVGLADTGLEVNHPDLRPYHLDGANWVFDGGSFRAQFSYDFGYDDANVDEAETQLDKTKDPPAWITPTNLGHGTHTSGIIAANTNNGRGVAGACWNCSLMMAKISRIDDRGFNGDLSIDAEASGITWLVDHGAQVLNASWGGQGNCSDDFDMTCSALAHVEDRDLTMFASSGNDETDINYPASDPRVISVGGISPDGMLWMESDCPPVTGYPPGTECGSNYTKTQGSAMQVLVAPAKNILSTTYEGWVWIQGKCADGSAYGLCTGTSMSSPYAAGVGALVRSANPLLTKANVRTILINNASRGGAWDPRLGYGIPNADASVQSALGKVAGQVLANRLTPLFSLYSAAAEDYYYTTVPQMASAAMFDPVTPYGSVGPYVNGYTAFPGTACNVSPCRRGPGASAYIFTSDHAPYAGAPALVPLYRMSFRGTNPNGNPQHRDTTYTTQVAGVTLFKSLGYELDGIEGYIHPNCTPEPGCIPSGAVRLYRRYNPQRDDFAIFPESELVQLESQGYTSTGGTNFNDVIGYVYPNVDTDGDGLIDGFELLIGTNPQTADSDCDGVSDGVEVLNYPYGDPLGSPGCAPLATPASITATASGTSVVVTWSASANADAYHLERKVTGQAWSEVAATPVSANPPTTLTDAAPPPTDDGIAVYRVRASKGTFFSPYSPLDFAHPKPFTDNVISTTITTVKAVHLVEIRKGINAIADAAGLTLPYAAGDLLASSVAGHLILATDMTDAMSRLNALRTSSPYGRTAAGFTVTPVSNGLIRGSQMVDLRAGLQ